MVNHVITWMTYGMLSISHITLLKTDQLIHNSLRKLPLVLQLNGPPFSSTEIHEALNKCNNSSAPGPDYLLWRHLKRILYDEGCMTNIVNIANACINLSYWPMHFKRSSFIIIPKPNKSLYDSLKSFQPIVLLNTIGKLIEKVMSNRIQVHAISSNFLYPNQLGGIQQCSTTDAGVYLTHIICAGWIKELHTSTLVFDIAQFFSSLNYHLIPLILTKASFDNRIS